MPQLDWFNNPGLVEDLRDAQGDEWVNEQEKKRNDLLKPLLDVAPLHSQDPYFYFRYLHEIMITKKCSQAFPWMELHGHCGQLDIEKAVYTSGEMNYGMPKNLVQAHEDVAAAGMYDLVEKKWLAFGALDVYKTEYRFEDDARYEVEAFNERGEIVKAQCSEKECLDLLYLGEVAEHGFWLAGERYQVSRKELNSESLGLPTVSWAFVNRPGRGAYVHFSEEHLVFMAFWRGSPDENGYKCRVHLEEFENTLRHSLRVLDPDRINSWRAWKNGLQVLVTAQCAACGKRKFGYIGVDMEHTEKMNTYSPEQGSAIVEWADVLNLPGVQLYCHTCTTEREFNSVLAAQKHLIGMHILPRDPAFRMRCTRMDNTARLETAPREDRLTVKFVIERADKNAKIKGRKQLYKGSATTHEGLPGFPFEWHGFAHRKTYEVTSKQVVLAWTEGAPATKLDFVTEGTVVESLVFIKASGAGEAEIEPRECHFCERRLAAKAYRKVLVFAWDIANDVWLRYFLEDLGGWDSDGLELACRRCAVDRGFAAEAVNGEDSSLTPQDDDLQDADEEDSDGPSEVMDGAELSSDPESESPEEIARKEQAKLDEAEEEAFLAYQQRLKEEHAREQALAEEQGEASEEEDDDDLGFSETEI